MRNVIRCIAAMLVAALGVYIFGLILTVTWDRGLWWLPSVTAAAVVLLSFLL